MKIARAEDENMFCSCSNKLSRYLGFLSGLIIVDNKLFLCHDCVDVFSSRSLFYKLLL